MSKQEIRQELSEFLLQYYDGSNQKCCIRKKLLLKWNTYENNEINPHFILVSCFMQQGHS